MGLVGKKIRMGRIFNGDGRTFVITMDHGISLGSVRGLEDINATVKKSLVGDYKPDAILLTPAMIRHCYEDLAGMLGTIARIDGAATTIGPDVTDWRLISSVKESLSIGADAVCTMAFIGGEREAQNSEKVGKVSQACERWGVPQVVEALSPDIVSHHFKREAEWKWPDPDLVKLAARVSAELGADVVKSYYTGDPDSFREVVKGCPVPIIVLSGPEAKNPEGLFRIVQDAIVAGAKGVVMGRNVWGHKNSTDMVEAISRIVHEEETIEKALKIIGA